MPYSGRDPELDDIFGADRELLDIACLIRDARPDPVADPAFRARLRAQLMADARVRLVPRRGWMRGRVRQGIWARAALGAVTMAGAAGIVMIAGVARILFTSHLHNQVAFVEAHSQLDEHFQVSLDDVITVSFSQPMNQQAVVRGLHIEPATSVRTEWHGTDLVIRPVHRLAANTPYTVTIDKPALRAQDGNIAAQPVRIAFGTAATPPPVALVAPAQPPTLATKVIGAAVAGSRVLFAPDGSIVVTAAPLGSGSAPARATGSSPSAPVASVSPTGLPPSPPVPTPPVTSPLASAGAGAAATATPAASTMPPPPVSAYLTSYGSDGPLRLGGAVAAAAYSPNGRELAMMVPRPDGHGADVVVSHADGSASTTLTTTELRVGDLAWMSGDTVLFVDAGRIRAVTLQRQLRDVASVGDATSVTLVSNGRLAYLGSASGSGRLLDLTTGTSRPMGGPGAQVAFGAAGQLAALVDSDQGGTHLSVSATDHNTALPLTTFAGPAGALALSDDGSRVAYGMTRSGSPTLAIADTASGHVLAYVPTGALVPVSAAFSPSGDRIAVVDGGNLRVVQLSAAGTPPPTPPVSDAVGSAINSFVAAQLQGDGPSMLGLATGDVHAASLTPPGLTRSYVISLVPSSTGATAQVRLIIDPSAQRPASAADESVVVTRQSDGGYLVSKLTVTSLQRQEPGPHVVHVTSAAHDVETVRVTFDSDLEAGSVATAVSVQRRDGTVIPSRVTYDADSRTAEVTLLGPVVHDVVVTVATSLADVSGQHLATAFSSDLSG